MSNKSLIFKINLLFSLYITYTKSDHIIIQFFCFKSVHSDIIMISINQLRFALLVTCNVFKSKINSLTIG